MGENLRNGVLQRNPTHMPIDCTMFVSSIYDKTMGTYRITTADQIYINCGQQDVPDN